MEILYWLASQPLAVSGPIFIGTGVFFGLLGVYIVNQYLTAAELALNNFVAGFKFTYLAQVFTGIVAFTLIEQAHKYGDANEHVFSEAAMLGYFDQTLSELSDPSARETREAVREYVRSVIEDEFPTMQRGQESPEAAHRFIGIYDSYVKIDPKSPREASALYMANQLLSRVTEHRSGRLTAASGRLLGLIWLTIGLGLASSIVWIWFFGSANLLTQMAMGAMLTTANMMVAYYLLVASFPFLGDLAVSPEAWEALLSIPIK